MKKTKKSRSRKRLCICLAAGSFLAVSAILLLAGRLAPSAVDYSGLQIEYTDADCGAADENAAPVFLEDGGSTAAADGVDVSGNTVTITDAGTYRISGTLSDGCVCVEAGSGDTVHLILAGADITCSTCPPIYILSAGSVIITPEDGTENTVTSTVSDGLASAIYSACDLSFTGSGTLNAVSGNGIGVNGKACIYIAGGNYTVSADSVGIKAKYGVYVTGGSLSLTSGKDGIHTTGFGRADGSWLGAVCLQGGCITIDSAGDAVSAGSVLCVSGGELHIVSGGGSTEPAVNSFGPGGASGEQADSSDDESAKGLKAETGVLICGGTITADCADDAVHSDGDVTITGGTLTLLSSDDGILGDRSVNIEGGSITVGRCSEGLEAHYITIDDGTVIVTAADDGVNANAGSNPIAVLGKLLETEIAGTGGRLIINGGTLTVTASGDGLDANGSIVQTGGTVTVNCTSNGADGALDFDGVFRMTGGQLAAFGNSGMMLETITVRKSTVCCVTVGADVSAGSAVSVSDALGRELLTVISSAQASSLVLAADTLTADEEITVSVDGTEIGSGVLSDESAQIGTLSASGGGSGEFSAASGEPGRDGSHGGMPGMGMPFLRQLPIAVAVLAAAAVLVILCVRRRKKRKQQADR